MKHYSILLIACAYAIIPLASGEDKLLFNRDVRPILSENCYRCHGPDKGNRKAKMRLDQRESALVKALVPGKPDESEMIKRIHSKDPEELMPPPDSHKQLTQKQKETLKRWIVEGAQYQPHWAYITPLRPALPAVKQQEWVQNPIDAFVLHGLEEKGIQHSKEVDKRMLLRRLSLDLTGLPPTTDEVAAFVADPNPNAYEKNVERLLASPHFGERMAVPWLDAVRFADTVGYHGDQNQNIFPYRDYVIDAFNKNKPFDQFTLEQLAGDLLPGATDEQRVATGYNRLNMMTREGGAQPKEYLAKYAADRVRTLSGAWLGSTMGCCECHDHKFDPFTARDFYSMEAFFADVKQWGVYQDYGYTPNPDLKGFTNEYPFPPELEVESPYLKERIEKLRVRVGSAVATASGNVETDVQAQAAFSKWRATVSAFLKTWPSGWMVPMCAVSMKDAEPSKPAEYSLQADASILFTGKLSELKLEQLPPWLAVLKIEALPDKKHGNTILTGGKKNADVKFSATLNQAAQKKEVPLAFRFADANYRAPVYKNGFALIGMGTGIKTVWKISDEQLNAPHVAFWLLEKPLQTSPGDTLSIKLPDNTLGRVRISVSPLSFPPDGKPEFNVAVLKAFVDSKAHCNSDNSRVSQETYLRSTAWDAAAYDEVNKIDTEILECRNGRAKSMVTEAMKPLPIRVLARGNWQDESGELVQPNVPRFLPQIANSSGSGRLTRLDLAKWLVAPENPLTSRAVMNRLWKQFFGMGLSAVVDDLGGQGEWPVHPELLDWLAVEFRESGWDQKHMVRLLVLSSTYRQDSNLPPELRDIDPGNRLLASQSPRRLEAEIVRDNALAIAGLLNLDIGGPSVHPFQPKGYYAAIQFPDRDYYTESDERQYRRGLYTHWQRTFLHPAMANFDAPAREECTCSRNLANTPQQALTLLNDPEFVEAARVFAQHLLASPAASDTARLEIAFQHALARPPKAKESESLTAFLGAQRAHYQSGEDDPRKLIGIGHTPVPEKIDPVELAAWTSVCRVILNLHETITRY